LDWLKGFCDQPVAKVLTGLRRSGKSSILRQTADWLRTEHASPERVVHLDFDLLSTARLRAAEALEAHIKDSTPETGPVYVLLDEVQEVADWERLVNSLLAEGRADVYLTGSNSKVLSSELATYITGRYVELAVAPLTFAEHLDFVRTLGVRPVGDTDAEFNRYLIAGGFPGLHVADLSEAQTQQMVGDIYRSILVKDVLTRHPVRQADLFERVAQFAFDNAGQSFSARRVSAHLKSQQRQLSHQTVAEYLGYLEEAFLIRRVPRNDLRGRAILATNEKFYPGDHGIVNALFGYDPTRLPGLLESVVAAELRHRGYSVTVGRVGEAEVDFVADRAGDRVYVQVAATILDPETRRREFAPLQAIRDSHPKLVLTLDTVAGGSVDGIRHRRLQDFLLD
jgi:predicted AAA+ superfamily ATPase